MTATNKELSRFLQDIVEYKKRVNKFQRLENEMRYLDKLLELARRNLSLRELDELIDYIAKIRKRIDELGGICEKIREELTAIEPEYIKKLSKAREIIIPLKNELANLLRSGALLEKVINKIVSTYDELSEIIKDLRKSLEKMEALEEQAPKEYLEVIENERMRIKEVLKDAVFFSVLAKPPIRKIKDAWNLLGYSVSLKGGSNEKSSMIVSGVYISRDLSTILLEISKERSISPDLFEELYKHIGIEFGAKDPEDLKQKLLSEMGISEEQLLASHIREFLKERKFLSKELEVLLKPQYTRIEFVQYDPKSFIIEEDQRNIRISEDLIIREVDAFKAPSLRVFDSSEIIGARLAIDNYNYIIYTQELLPERGFCLIMLKRNEKGEPEPALSFVKSLLEIVQKHGRKALPFIKRIDKSDLLWSLRLLVMRGLKELNLTETIALRPSYLFSFCLKYRIPVLYEEILENYFHALPTEFIELVNGKLKLKLPIDPEPLSRVISKKNMLSYAGKEFIDLIGVSAIRGDVILHLVKRLSEEELTRICAEYDLDEKIVRIAGYNPKRVLRILIYKGRIKSLQEYRSVKEKLGIKSVKLSEILGDINEEDFLRRFLLRNSMLRGG